MTLREAASWSLYWTGDLVCKTIVNRTLGHWFEWPYRLYSRIMALALNIQGDGPGPWGPPEPLDDEE